MSFHVEHDQRICVAEKGELQEVIAYGKETSKTGISSVIFGASGRCQEIPWGY